MATDRQPMPRLLIRIRAFKSLLLSTGAVVLCVIVGTAVLVHRIHQIGDQIDGITHQIEARTSP